MNRPAARVNLEAGAVTASARRRGFWSIFLIALLWRAIPLVRIVKDAEGAAGSLGESAYLGPFQGAGFGLTAFITHEPLAWVGSPLFMMLTALEVSLGYEGGLLLLLNSLLSVLLPCAVYRIGLGWLGFPAALLAGIFCALSQQAILGGLMILPALPFALLSLYYVRQLNLVARTREMRPCLHLGAFAGLLSLLSGMGSLWVVVTLAWLPSQSKSFRRKGWLVSGGLFLGGWIAVISPVLLHGAMVQKDFIVPFANAPYDLYLGTTDASAFQADDDDHIVYPAGRHARSISKQEYARGTAAPKHELARGASYLAMSISSFGEDPGGVVSKWLRRWGAFFGGAAPGPILQVGGNEAMRKVVPLPLGFILVLCWLGTVALLGSFRSFAPLYLGVAIPLIVAVFTGVTGRGQLVALPFLCLLGGYGAARVWLARRWPLTWVLAPAVALVGFWVVYAF